MKKRMISLVSLILLLCIPCSWLFTHSKYFYDTFENLYIDKIYNIYNSTSFSLFTSVVNIFASVTCIYLVPFYVNKIIDPNFEFGKKTKHLIVIVRRNYLLVFLFVLFVIFPVAIIGNIPIKEAFKECFLGPNIFAHFLSPFLFLLGTCLFVNEKSDLKLNLIAISPALIYALIYSFMVFIFKTWEDFYYINNVIEVIGFFAFPLIILLLLGCNLLAACLDIAFSKYITKRCKK